MESRAAQIIHEGFTTTLGLFAAQTMIGPARNASLGFASRSGGGKPKWAEKTESTKAALPFLASATQRP